MGSRFVTCVELILRLSEKPRDGDWACLVESMVYLSDAKDQREFEVCQRLMKALKLNN